VLATYIKERFLLVEGHSEIAIQVQGFGQVKINSGNSCLLWDDLWGDDILANKYPELLSFPRKKTDHFQSRIFSNSSAWPVPPALISSGPCPTSTFARRSQ